jgi:hypothetical protein
MDFASSFDAWLPPKETTDARANREIPRHAAARCAHQNRNPDVQAVTVGNTLPRSQLQAENRIGFFRSGLSNVTACAMFDLTQWRPRVSTIPE